MLCTPFLSHALNPSPLKAATADVQITALQCGAVDHRGVTSVVYTGTLGGSAYLNVTNIGALGLPFTQQARVESVNAEDGTLRFTLRSMVTGQTVYFELKDGSSEGLLTTYPGDDSAGVKLNCVSKIQVTAVP